MLPIALRGTQIVQNVEEKTLIDVRDAVAAATKYFQEVRERIGNLKDLRLEEIELSDDEKFWLITLGFEIVPQNSPIPDIVRDPLFPKIERKESEREYKIFKIDAKTGEVKSMKIRIV
ncbi:MAG: hypothetical protein AAGA60_03815 [Cyanobacteria bacterium P01_E01_bin.42]